MHLNENEVKQVLTEIENAQTLGEVTAAIENYSASAYSTNGKENGVRVDLIGGLR